MSNLSSAGRRRRVSATTGTCIGHDSGSREAVLVSSLPALPVPRHSEYVSTPPGEGKYLPPRPRPVFARLQRSGLGPGRQASPLAAVSSPRRPWSGVVCSDRRPHGLRRGACMSPNGPEPPRQPRSHVGQTQAPAARWDGSAPMEPSANGSERAREAETAECAGGGPLLLSRGLRGPERQTQKYRDDGGAQRRNSRF